MATDDHFSVEIQTTRRHIAKYHKSGKDEYCDCDCPGWVSDGCKHYGALKLAGHIRIRHTKCKRETVEEYEVEVDVKIAATIYYEGEEELCSPNCDGHKLGSRGRCKFFEQTTMRGIHYVRPQACKDA